MAILSKRTRSGKIGKGEMGPIEKVIATQNGVTFSFVGGDVNLTHAELRNINFNADLALVNPGKYVNNGKVLKT
jgi:hypothetical protein